jgi:hypothetical protein
LFSDLLIGLWSIGNDANGGDLSMIVLYSLTIVLIIVIVVVSRGGSGGSSKPFAKSASFLIYSIYQIKSNRPANLRRHNIKKTDRTAVKNLKVLYPGQDIEKKIMAHKIEKLRIVLLFVFVGSTFALIISLIQYQNSRINQSGEISRNSWEEGVLSLSLEAKGTVTEDIIITIDPRNLTRVEAGKLAEEVFQKLTGSILQKNTSLLYITGTLDLITRLENYPFVIKWESDRPQIIRSTGEVYNEAIASGGEQVVLLVTLTYQGNDREFFFTKEMILMVYPPERSDQVKWRESLLQAVNEENIKSADSAHYRLPQTVEGQSVKWRESPQNEGFYLWLIFIMAAGVAFYAKDDELRKKVIKRGRQSDKDYPELVRKLTLYLGAGMTVKRTWKKMISDYIDQRREGEYRVLYEEMLISLRELENGCSEQEVYYRFGKRLGSNRYRKLMSLLCNHLRRGNNNLLQVLREEADLALEEQKNRARVSSEEMGTRLLLPMMLMLMVVIIIIMIPAFEMF